METVKIAHLYYDLMNLYGEIGNIKALEENLKLQDVDVKVVNLSIDDKLNFKDYDVIYIGSGTEEMRDKVLEHLSTYKDEIKKYLDKGMFIIATGNAYPLFGNNIIDSNNQIKKALEIFDYNEISSKRIVSEKHVKSSFIESDIYGFLNHYNNILSNDLMFSDTGYCNNHFYGTYLIGPLLIRNPKLLSYLIKETLKYKDIDYKDLDLSLEENAYLNFIYFKNVKNKKRFYLQKYKTGFKK